MYEVTTQAMRKASKAQECFYCQRPIGAAHTADCVLIKKKVKVRMMVEYEVAVPAHWDKNNIEFHRNEGTWCANNAISELQELALSGCLCSCVAFQHLEDTSVPYLEEK